MAFDLGLDRAGHRCVGQVEIDKDCSRVLAHHWSSVERCQDVTKYKGKRGSAELVCAGWPCQGNSVAGKRGGMADPRSGLFHQVICVLDETAARLFLGENVPGILSVHKGEDWSTVLEMLTGYRPEAPQDGWRNSGFCIGPKRSAAWCVLDLQWFGIPQRRRRVFVVADTRRGAGPAQILSLGESGEWDLEASREGKDVAGCLGGGAAGRGWNDDTDRAGAFVEGFRTSGNCGVMPQGDRVAALNTATDPNQTLIASTLRSHQASKGVSQPGRGGEDDANIVYQCQGSNVGGVPFIAHTLRAEGHDASEDGTGRGVPLVFESTIARNGRGAPDTKARALRASADGGRADCRPMVFNPHRTLQKDGSVAEGFKPDRIVDALHGPTGNKEPLVGGIRRLTPLECERLMGLPDNWTQFGVDAHGNLIAMSDSARYRMCGNSVGIPVVEWIGRRIKEAVGAVSRLAPAERPCATARDWGANGTS